MEKIINKKLVLVIVLGVIILIIAGIVISHKSHKQDDVIADDPEMEMIDESENDFTDEEIGGIDIEQDEQSSDTATVSKSKKKSSGKSKSTSKNKSKQDSSNNDSKIDDGQKDDGLMHSTKSAKRHETEIMINE